MSVYSYTVAIECSYDYLQTYRTHSDAIYLIPKVWKCIAVHKAIPHFLAGLFSYFFKEREGTKEAGDARDREGRRKKRDYTQVQFPAAQVEARSLQACQIWTATSLFGCLVHRQLGFQSTHSESINKDALSSPMHETYDPIVSLQGDSLLFPNKANSLPLGD